MPGIDAIIFDMDGVLCDSEPFILEAAIQMFRETYGVEIAPEAFTPYVGTGEDRYLGGPAAEAGVSLALPRDKERTYHIYLELIVGRMPALPGVHDFTAAARQHGIKIAVASAADRMKVDGNLREIGLGNDHFDAVITGSDVNRKKPAPDGFLLAAKRMGADPARCLVVEDAINGVEAALAAGARCLGLSTSFAPERLQAAGAHWTAPNLADVPEPLVRVLGFA
ncbi:MAG: HAD-IA family hydrolase [Planctomycetota bacterium]|jgi:beta-phosphoglucomutase|nr:HAD-IA family hydrolase [Planctomycetota bacterium]